MKSAVIIGYGRMGKEHERAYKECGIADILLTGKYSWEVAVRDAEPSYVSVCSYDDAHADQICYALERGHKVIAEKPLCLTEDDLKRIYKLATPETLYCNLPLLNKQWPTGTDASHIQTNYTWGRADVLPGWRGAVSGFSFVLGAGVHMTSLAQHLKGRAIEWVEAVGYRNNAGISCETCIDVSGSFVGGATFGAYIDCSTVERHMHYVRIMCEHSNHTIENYQTDKTAGIKRFIYGIHQNFHNAFAAHSVCFAIERALKSGKREEVQYLS